MSPARLLTGGTLIAALALLGCASNEVEENFGLAQSELRERQIQNPEQSEVRNPVDGLGATTAADVIRNYHENQKTDRQIERQERARDNGLVDTN